MSTAATARRARPCSALRDANSPDIRLPHWSEVSPLCEPRPDEPRPRPTPTVAAVLRDLVAWAADLGILLTREYPEERAAILEVRGYAYAWLAGEPCPDVRSQDVLTSVATLLSSIDLNLERTPRRSKADRSRASSIKAVAS